MPRVTAQDRLAPKSGELAQAVGVAWHVAPEAPAAAMARPAHAAQAADLLENPTGKAKRARGRIQVRPRPFEVKTLALTDWSAYRPNNPSGRSVSAAGRARESMATQVQFTAIIALDGDQWQLAIDAANVGREERWYEGPRGAARPTHVPWVIQDQFPDYHGVAWYWRDIDVPADRHVGGACLLRFKALDYLAQVWVNAVPVGAHAGAEEPLVLDATAAIRPGTAEA